jgi:tetratricopeptide (TPR) repeat protein
VIQRKLNLPVLAISLLAVVLAAVTFQAVRKWQLSRLSHALLVRSRQQEQSQDLPAAIATLEHYLRLAPRNQTARAQLAALSAQTAHTLTDKQRAIALHYRALAGDLGTAADDVRAQLAELLLETGRLLEAETEARAVLERVPAQPRAARALALARVYQWTGGSLAAQRPEELQLLQQIEAALESNPADLTLAEVAAILLREHPAIVAAWRPDLNQLARQQLANSRLDRAVEKNPQSATVWLARYRYRTKYGLAGAEDDLKQALALGPRDGQILLLAAAARFDEARSLVDRGAAGDAKEPLAAAGRLLERLITEKLAPENVEVYLKAGDVAALAGDASAALAYWRDGLAKCKKPTEQVALQARVAGRLIDAGQIDEAEPALAAIDSLLADLAGTIHREQHLALSQSQGLRRATAQIHRGRFAEAIGELEQAIARQPQLQPDPRVAHAAWNLLGVAYAGLEDWTTSATAYDRAANFQRKAAHTRLAAARSWLAAGRPDLAVDRAQETLLLENQLEAWLVLGNAELEVQAARPLDQRKWQLSESVRKALDSSPDRAGLPAPWRTDFFVADYLALRAASQPAQPSDGTSDHTPDYSSALEVLRSAESKYTEAQFWFELCLAYQRLRQPDDADRAVAHLRAEPGAESSSAIVAARRASQRHEYASAEQLLTAAEATAPAADKDRLRRELLLVAEAQQDLPKMQQVLDEQLRAHPGDIAALCRLAELALRQGDLALLERHEQALRSQGSLGSLWGRYFRAARLYVSAKDARDPSLQEALSEQAQLATLRPNWPESFALRGAIEQRRENYEAAAAAYEQAVQLGERRYAVIEQLVACLDKLNRYEEAERHLARLEALVPASQRLTELAGQHQLGLNRPERAIEIARHAAARRPDDLPARLWLGRLLLINNRPDEAREVFQKATETAPEDARSWTGLFSYCMRAKDRAGAEQALASLAKQAKLPPVERDLLLIQAWLQLGESQRALELATEASRQSPQRADVQLQLGRLLLDSDRERAKSHLQRAVALDPKLSQARWLLAALLAAGGQEEDLAAAEQLLSDAAVGGTATAEDRRVRAILLAQHGGPNGLARGIALLEQIASERGSLANDRLLLAQFYEREAAASTDPAVAAARIKAARDQLVALANRSHAQAADVAALISFFLRQGEKKDAGVWLDRLEERLQAMPAADAATIAQFIQLSLEHGGERNCERWLEKLESLDANPLRPLLIKVKFLVARGRKHEIESAVEPKAKTLVAGAPAGARRAEMARAIGEIYQSADDLRRAERWYRAAIREDAAQFPPLALTLLRLGRAQEAVGLCQTAAEHDRTSRPALVLAGILLETGVQPGHVELGEELLTTALRQFPRDDELYYRVGMVRILQDKYADAVALLRHVLEVNPRHVPALNNLAVILAEQPDRRRESLDLIDRAIGLRGQQPTLLDTKGTILALSGKTTEAVILLEAAARGVHADPRHRFHLAVVYQDMGAVERARSALNTALEDDLERQILTPTDRKLLDRLAVGGRLR